MHAILEMKRVKGKKAKELCPISRCRNLVRVGHKICSKHEMRIWRQANPEKAVYGNLKHNARQRGIIFTLSFDDFLSIIEGTEYMTRRGKGPGFLQIDRKNATKGYVPGNCCVVESTFNTSKGNYERACDHYKAHLAKRDPLAQRYKSERQLLIEGGFNTNDQDPF